MAKTTRWEHPYPETGDAADVPKWMKDLATNLDDVAKDDQGAVSSRPTSSVGTPGKKGRYYFATDEGVLYRDNGTGWDNVSDVRWHQSVSIEADQNRENAAYGTLTTPDEIKEVVVPKGGIVLVAYTALWQNTVNSKGRAAIFLGNNQLKTFDDTGSVHTTAAVGGGGGVNNGNRLTTCQAGLISSVSSGTYLTGAPLPTTGVTMGGMFDEIAPQIEQSGVVKELAKGIYGGLCPIVGLAAGTYTVSVRFKASEGKVQARDRTLWVGVLGQ